MVYIFLVSKVNLQIIKGVIGQHHLRSTDNNLVLSNDDIESILHDILYAASTDNDRSNVSLSLELAKLILNEIFLK